MPLFLCQPSAVSASLGTASVHVPGCDSLWGDPLIRPKILYNDDNCDIPGPDHTQAAEREQNLGMW